VVAVFGFYRTVGARCTLVKRVEEPFAPVLMMSSTHLGAVAAASECWLQLRPELFSCAESISGSRVCPCRQYKRHQIALLPDVTVAVADTLPTPASDIPLQT